jgi:hypothetical protein
VLSPLANAAVGQVLSRLVFFFLRKLAVYKQ